MLDPVLDDAVVCVDVCLSHPRGEGVVLPVLVGHDGEREEGLQACDVYPEHEVTIADLHCGAVTRRGWDGVVARDDGMTVDARGSRHDGNEG